MHCFKTMHVKSSTRGREGLGLMIKKIRFWYSTYKQTLFYQKKEAGRLWTKGDPAQKKSQQSNYTVSSPQRKSLKRTPQIYAHSLLEDHNTTPLIPSWTKLNPGKQHQVHQAEETLNRKMTPPPKKKTNKRTNEQTKQHNTNKTKQTNKANKLNKQNREKTNDAQWDT